MDSDHFRSILSRSGFEIWDIIEAAIQVAGSDFSDELCRRRDGIVQSLYAPSSRVCRNFGGHDDGRQEQVFCNHSNNNNIYHQNSNIHNSRDDIENDKHIREDDKIFGADELKSHRNFNEAHCSSPLTPESNHRNFGGGEEGEEPVPFGGLFDDEQTRILSIKERLEDQNQSEGPVVELLQNLADMDITFQALKETDIGRHVNRLRKHPSDEVKRLVKQLVRKWKETVDEWVNVNEPQKTSRLIADVDSPQQSILKNHQNGHHQVFDNGYSPNPPNGKYDAETEAKPRQLQSSAPRRDPPPSKPPQSVPKSSPPPMRAQKEAPLDDERLNSARRRLQENYQEAQNAKRQRKIQVMDIHDIPKPKKAFIPKNNKGLQGRHHW